MTTRMGAIAVALHAALATAVVQMLEIGARKRSGA